MAGVLVFTSYEYPIRNNVLEFIDIEITSSATSSFDVTTIIMKHVSLRKRPNHTEHSELQFAISQGAAYYPESENALTQSSDLL